MCVRPYECVKAVRNFADFPPVSVNSAGFKSVKFELFRRAATRGRRNPGRWFEDAYPERPCARCFPTPRDELRRRATFVLAGPAQPVSTPRSVDHGEANCSIRRLRLIGRIGDNGSNTGELRVQLHSAFRKSRDQEPDNLLMKRPQLVHRHLTKIPISGHSTPPPW